MPYRSALTSWILVISAPFYSLLVLTALVVLIQLVGNGLLVVGAVLLTLNPWIYVAFRKWYVASYDSVQERRLDRVQRAAGFFNVLGFLLVLIWALSSGVLGDVIGWGSAVRFVVLGFGNGLVTSLVFCDAFLRMTVTNWKSDKARREQLTGAFVDELFGSIEGSIRKPGSVSKPSSTTSSITGSGSGGAAAVPPSLDSIEAALVPAGLVNNNPPTYDNEKDVEIQVQIADARVDDPTMHESFSSSSHSPHAAEAIAASVLPLTTTTTPQLHKVVRRTYTNADGTSSTVVIEETVHPDGSKTVVKKTVVPVNSTQV